MVSVGNEEGMSSTVELNLMKGVNHHRAFSGWTGDVVEVEESQDVVWPVDTHDYTYLITLLAMHDASFFVACIFSQWIVE